MAHYSFRKSALSDEETYRLENDALVWGANDTTSNHWPLRDITTVNLRFDPTRFSRERYKIVLHNKSGKKLTLSNMSYAGVGDFESRSPAYKTFVRALHAALAQATPSPRFFGGVSQTAYVFYWLLTILTGVLVIVASFAFIAVGLSLLIIVKLLLIAFYFPTLIAFMKRAKPFKYQPDHIPKNLLPR